MNTLTKLIRYLGNSQKTEELFAEIRRDRRRNELRRLCAVGKMTPADWREWPIDWTVPKERRPICGAKTRNGEPCKRRAVSGRWRCPNHGGLSTGPRTREGRAKIAEINQARAVRLRQDREAKWILDGPMIEAKTRELLAAQGWSTEQIEATLSKLSIMDSGCAHDSVRVRTEIK